MLPISWLTLWLLIVPLAGFPSLFGGNATERYEQENTTWVYPPWEHTWGIVRATQAELTVYSFGMAHFRNPQGLAAVRLTATDDPDKTGDDDEVTVYGVNSGENSIIYNKSMTSLGFYGYEDQGEGNLLEPWDVAALPNGLVFVTDSGHRRVCKMRNIGGELRYESSFGADAPASLVLPRGIAVTGGGKVLVADAGSGRVVIFDTSGVYLKEVKGLKTPVGLAAVDFNSVYVRPPREYFVVSDSGGQRIRKMSFEGRLLHEVDVPEATGLKDAYVGHLATDIYNNVAATDSVDCCILKFDHKLDFLSAWGEKGKGRTRFIGPTGITIWRRYGQTFVAERKGAHYLWVGADFSRPPSLSLERGPVIRLRFGLTERARMVLELVDSKGNVIRSLTSNEYPGDQNINWLLNRQTTPITIPDSGIVRPSELAPPPPGDYTLRIRMRATYSSRKVFEKVVETKVTLTKDLYR